MEIEGTRAVVTGGGSGIGAALARALAAAGAEAVVVADLDAGAATAVAAEIGGVGLGVDVGREAEVSRLVEASEESVGPIDLFCSNAGVAGPSGGPEVDDREWQRTWDINVMAHVWAARALLPGMLERGRGHLSSTASAAGLLASPGVMPYSVTKHAAVAVAEWLAITYGGPGTGVSFSCFCPQGVATPMLRNWEAVDPSAQLASASGAVLSPDDAVAGLLRGWREDRFLIFSHPEVQGYQEERVADRDRWLAGLQRYQAKIDKARAEGSSDDG